VRSRAIFSVLAVCTGFVLTCLMLRQYAFPHPAGGRVTNASVGNIGAQMLSTSEHGYVLPFEVISILLLAAMVGCIVIAIKIKPEDK
jgi:NADH-quinone oxidoreductase subunit J